MVRNLSEEIHETLLQKILHVILHITWTNEAHNKQILECGCFKIIEKAGQFEEFILVFRDFQTLVNKLLDCKLLILKYLV